MANAKDVLILVLVEDGLRVLMAAILIGYFIVS